MHNLQEVKCTFFNFFLGSTRELAAAALANNCTGYGEGPGRWVAARTPFLQGGEFRMTPICSPVKPDPEQLYWLHPEEVAAAPGSAAQFPNNYTGTGIPITWNPDNPNNLVQTLVLSSPTPILQSRTISIKTRGRSPIPPR